MSNIVCVCSFLVQFWKQPLEQDEEASKDKTNTPHH